MTIANVPTTLAAPDPTTMGIIIVVGLVAFAVLFGLLMLIIKCYRKVEPGTALVIRGKGGPKAEFNGKVVIPVLHRADVMDVSVKRLEIYRHGSEGLICKDNVRADIKVAFFIRVNNVAKDVLQVADSIGVRRASDLDRLVELFDAKFSEALKTVGKKFDFTDLYTERDKFKDEILAHIGTDLNGYILDDAAIDYLEQTDLEKLDPNNILDAEGIKKITDLTAHEAVQANDIAREKEKTIKKQDVEAREAILELERQEADAVAKQEREIATVQAREAAEAQKVEEEERYKSEKARISTEEELGVAEENKQRQVIIAARNREKADKVEAERVAREQQLEATERERLVELATIEKDKAVEVEKKAIQDVIRERVVVERAVVEEEEKIKDTHEIAAAKRAKEVTVTAAQAVAEEDKVKEVKKAEASKLASQFEADEILIEAEAGRQAAEKEAIGKIKLAEAVRAEQAASGLAEAEVMNAKAGAVQKYGSAEAEVVQKKAEAEAAGDLAMAEAIKAKGLAEAESERAGFDAEAEGMQKRYAAEADGVAAKAEAMQKLDGVGKEHEEYKLQLDKDLKVELAEINIKKDIVAEQAKILGEALKSAKIDIIGGETEIFDTLLHSVTQGKRADRLFDSSKHLSDIKSTFFNGDGEYFGRQVKSIIDQVGIDSEDAKNLSVAALLTQIMTKDKGGKLKEQISDLLGLAKQAGVEDKTVGSLGLLN
ncbi:MAG: flotillin family protein [Phycisphaeraceae bacterium]|nr:flotillin family protein [Phycisphaeraceae bacterium]